MIKIGKEYIWQMSHRLPYHDAGCENIHGHSYKLFVELWGELNERGMLMDFYDMNKIVEPFVMGKLDHGFICSNDDKKMIAFLQENNFKHYVFNKFTTCENMCQMFIDEFKPKFAEFSNIKKMAVKVYETADAYAYLESEI